MKRFAACLMAFVAAGVAAEALASGPTAAAQDKPAGKPDDKTPPKKDEKKPEEKKPVAEAWGTDYEGDRRRQEGQRRSSCDFTGDWCGWCQKLKAEVFDKPGSRTGPEESSCSSSTSRSTGAAEGSEAERRAPEEAQGRFLSDHPVLQQEGQWSARWVTWKADPRPGSRRPKRPSRRSTGTNARNRISTVRPRRYPFRQGAFHSIVGRNVAAYHAARE